jgi:molybdopterin converting factor subunit 1
MRILLFAQVKDAIGVAELAVTISGELDAAALWGRLVELHPQLAPFRKTTRLARNGEYADARTIFTDADEVALIPPVSGG